MVAVACSASYDWTPIVCGISDTIAAVTKLHSLCNVVAL